MALETLIDVVVGACRIVFQVFVQGVVGWFLEGSGQLILRLLGFRHVNELIALLTGLAFWISLSVMLIAWLR